MRSHVSRLLLLLAVVGAACFGSQASAERVKSWLYIDHSATARVLTEGDDWEVPVEYYLAPAEDRGGMTLTLWGGGPWIDNPDGKYVATRHHVSYPGLQGSVPVERGHGRHVFRLKVPPALQQNGVLLIARLQDAEGRTVGLEFRRGRMWFVRKGGFFELETDQPGNLFTYEEPVRVSLRLKQAAIGGGEQKARYVVHDVRGQVVASGQAPFTPERAGQIVPIDLPLELRGTFHIEVEVDGWETRDTTFCRIPNLLAITGGAQTRFGMTNVVKPGPPERTDELCRIARRLGLTSCRVMDSWYDMEPGPDVFKLRPWENAFAIARRHGIDAWLCIYNPPAWAHTDVSGVGSYRAVSVDWAAWTGFVETVTERLKGKLYGWEWLNEITPGGTDDPVADYVRMVKLGAMTAKRIDPNVLSILAGGLWPRSYRTEMLKAGVAAHVDVLPVHYSNGDGIREAREDLASVGAQRVAVWDDESARGRNAWDVPPLEELAATNQANWILNQWTDELAAGCDRIIYFGGDGAPAGNWTYLLGDLRPRPVAATLAVFTSKMFRAEPVGAFALGSRGVFHLFERDGRAILVCSSYKEGDVVDLQVGTEQVTLTDYQGNETVVDSPGGVARLTLGSMRYFLEGGDPDILKAYAAPEVVTHKAAMRRSQLAQMPRVSMLQGGETEASVRVRNVFGRVLIGGVAIETPPGWPETAPATFRIAPGKEKIVTLPVPLPAGLAADDYSMAALITFADTKLPEIRKPFVASVLSPQMLGNLISNGSFEAPDDTGAGPAGWRVNGTTSQWVAPDGGLGLGERVLRFGESGDYVSSSQEADLRGGQTYLYTAWAWNQGMPAGSNIYLDKTDGTTESLYDVRVFKLSESTPYWQMYTSRVKTPENLKAARFSPLARGTGWALFDNVRVTLYDGTDFAAEGFRTTRKLAIDGKLDDWATGCPVPLIGRNQLTVVDDAYEWSPENVNGVAYLMWDEANLYVAVETLDDVHSALPGADAPKGDGLVLAFDPTNRAPGGEAKASALYVSSAVPGGGSGVHTIYRPEGRSGGMRAGHLFRDSSVYELAIARSAGKCTYEMRIPWSELGGLAPAVGRRFAFSIQLGDRDGAALAAHMNWGGGISPEWRPAECGVVTLVP